MKQMILSAGAAAAIACSSAYATSAAGILAYSCDTSASGAVYLLAYDPAKGREAWGHLGGQATLGETASQTAIREFHEESNCAYSIDMLSARPLGPESKAKSGFISFSIEIPFIAANEIAKRERTLCKDVEREKWVWVTHAQLVKGIDPTAPAGDSIQVFNGPISTVTLWPESAKAMAGLLLEAGSPLPDPCHKKSR